MINTLSYHLGTLQQHIRFVWSCQWPWLFWLDYFSPRYIPWLDQTHIWNATKIYLKGLIVYKKIHKSHSIGRWVCKRQYGIFWVRSQMNKLTRQRFKDACLMGQAWEEITTKHQTDLWSYCSLLQLTEDYTLVLLLGNTNSSSLATSCLGVLTTNTEAIRKRIFIFKVVSQKGLNTPSPKLRASIFFLQDLCLIKQDHAPCLQTEQKKILTGVKTKLSLCAWCHLNTFH